MLFVRTIMLVAIDRLAFFFAFFDRTIMLVAIDRLAFFFVSRRSFWTRSKYHSFFI